MSDDADFPTVKSRVVLAKGGKNPAPQKKKEGEGTKGGRKDGRKVGRKEG